jgi:hypothetical protein
VAIELLQSNSSIEQFEKPRMPMSLGQIRIVIMGALALLILIGLNTLWLWMRGDLVRLLSGEPLLYPSRLVLQGAFGAAIIGATIRGVIRVGRREKAKRIAENESNENRGSSNGH